MMAPGFAEELRAHGARVVSRGTLNLEYLYHSFRSALCQLDGDPRHFYDILEMTHVSPEAQRDQYHSFWRTPEAQHIVFEVLQSALQEIAPEGFWFGAHQDDGAVFGFWRVEPDE